LEDWKAGRLEDKKIGKREDGKNRNVAMEVD
jgi:hypothetical protein